MGNWAWNNKGWAQNSASSLLKRIYWAEE